MCACHVALVGATGIVGQEILRVLEERKFPVDHLTVLASRNSEGSRLEFRNQRHVVRLLTREAFAGVDIAFFAASAEASTAYATHAVQAGAVVIDSSSAFRLLPDIPLCVPEVNAEVLRRHHGIVAMPHSVTTQIALVLAPLHRAATLTRVVVSAYQSISAAGRRAVEEFDQQLRDLLNFRAVESEVFPHQIAFNCLPHCGEFLENAYTQDEMAVINETRKLLIAPDLPVTATAAYIPLAHSHSAAVYVETARALSLEDVRALLQRAPGVSIADDRQQGQYPQPVQANGRDEVFAGRFRTDPSTPHGLHVWTVTDNLRKGAALNAVQIAEHLVAAP